MSSKRLEIMIDRKRSLYHYYRKRSDLLSKCKAEVVLSELEELRSIRKNHLYNDKVRVFLDKHPEYQDKF